MTEAIQLDVALSRAIDCAVTGDIVSAISEMRQALARAGTEPTPAQGAMLIALESVLGMYQGRNHEALSAVLPLLDEIEAGDYSDRIDWLYTAIGYSLGSLGDPGRGLEWMARALAMTEARPASVGRRKAFSTQGILLAMLGEYDASMEALERALDIACKQGVPKAQAVCLDNLSFACIDRAWKTWGFDPVVDGRPLAAQALDFANRALAIANENGIPLLGGVAGNNRGFALLLLGEPVQALDVLLDASNATASHDHIHVDVLFGLALAYRLLGDFDAARRPLAMAESMARKGHFDRNLDRILQEGARLERAAGDLPSSLEWSGRYIEFLKIHYESRLKMLARSVELFAEAARTRREAAGLRKQSKAWEDVALHDALTGALNRVGLSRQVEALGKAAHPMAIALLDADHFKGINDRFGHAVGDVVLRHMAQIVRSHSRTGDLLARIGGEEFVLALVDAQLGSALATCERIRAAIEGHDWQSIASGMRVTVSMGLARQRDGETLEAATARADAAMYAAKQGGRNRVCVAVEP